MEAENLARKAKLIKASDYFVNHTELAPLIEKQSIFLALAGKKPVSQATSSKWIKTDHGAHAEPHDPHELEQFLDSLGLNYYLSADEYATDALVSLDPKKLDAYLAAEKADDAFKVGQLFGYPETALEAFVHDASLDFEAHDELMKKAGIPDMMPSFRLSKTHAPEELAVLKDWYQTLKEYELI